MDNQEQEQAGITHAVRSRVAPIANGVKRINDFFRDARETRDLLELGCLPMAASLLGFCGGVLVERGLINLPIPDEKRMPAVLIGGVVVLASRLAKKLISYKIEWNDRRRKDTENLERVYMGFYHLESTLLHFAGGAAVSYLTFNAERLINPPEPF